jgi:hypothetical protein
LNSSRGRSCVAFQRAASSLLPLAWDFGTRAVRILRAAASRHLCSKVLSSTLGVVWLLAGARAGLGQVSPAETLNPRLKPLEQTYLPQLTALNRAIQSTKFPFSFSLSRFVGLDPQQQTEADSRGVEFVEFHGRSVLKVTGNYNAAYNADRLTPNERASRTFQEVFVPVLQLIATEIPTDVACDAIGLEVAYHVRRRERNYDYEGKEILVVALDKADAFGYFNLARDSERQETLNRSEIFLDGKAFGLALGEREPFEVGSLDRSVIHPPSPAATADSDARLSRLSRDLPAGFRPPQGQPGSGALPEVKNPSSAAPPNPSPGPSPGSNPPPRAEAPGAVVERAAAAAPADAERLQAQCQSQLDALAKDGVAKLHFVDYAPPSFVVFQNQIFLQLTLRNPQRFEKDTGSIYKRAAQSFDLFLAPQLKDLLGKLPCGSDYAGLDITVLNQLDSKSAPSSEAIEFASSLKLLRRFADAEITNQHLINQSVVLVNGVRIKLDLQQVE